MDFPKEELRYAPSIVDERSIPLLSSLLLCTVPVKRHTEVGRTTSEQRTIRLNSHFHSNTFPLQTDFYSYSKSSGSSQEAHQEHQVQEGHQDPHQGPLLQNPNLVS